MKLGILVLVGAMLSDPASGSTDDSLPKLNCPVYVMEYHVWYRSPFGAGPQPGYAHWGDPEHIDSALPSDQNIRDIGAAAYPLLGLYDSENPDIIRWQLRCAHNAGIDGLFVHLFPDRATGTYLGGTKIFEIILRIAEEEHVQVAVHDEVMFRTGWKAQQPDVMSTRISDFIRKFGADPAYLKIDGHPVYAFQYWSRFIPPDTMVNCLDQAEHLLGSPIHFLIMGGADQLYQRTSPTSFVAGGNSMFIKADDPSGIPNAGDWFHLNAGLLKFSVLHELHPAHKFGLWAYPGFNNQPQTQMLADSHAKGFSRQNGNVLVQTLAAYNRARPDFIILSSWNDWMEGTAIEPGYRFETSGPAPDPYRYCRMLATAKGRTFEPPPLPPKEAIDPLRWQSLYGVDATPPLLRSSSPNGDHFNAMWTDSGYPVAESILAESGDASIDFLTDTSHGIHAEIAPERIISKSGFLLTGKIPLILHLEGLPPQGKGTLPEWYLALQFQEQGPAIITANYTAEPAVLDYREFDNLIFPAAAYMRTGTSGLIRTAVSLLRCANFSTAKEPVIMISLSSSENTPSQNVSVYLRRLDLFHSLSNRTEGICLNPNAKPNQDTHFQYPLANKPDVVFLFARDSKDNWSAPQAIPLNH